MLFGTVVVVLGQRQTYDLSSVTASIKVAPESGVQNRPLILSRTFMILPGMAMELSEDERTLQSLEISVKGLENVATAEARGAGSFGSVYEIEAHGLPCIAKCIRPVLIRYEQQIQGARRDVAKEKATICQRFYEECLLLSKLRHPNIVQFMGVARVSNTGEMALIMEALFSDLGNLVEQHKDISDPIKVSLMLDVANGLLFLHSQNPSIIHRDLSAANVLVSEDLRGKIADLGVAKLLDHGYMYSGQQTAQPGAYAYMAPEALKETPRYDIKLDIFHLEVYCCIQ